MPEFLEEKLEASGRKKHFKGSKLKQYIYGALNNLGAMRGNKETAKGRRMQAEHDEKVTMGHLMGSK